MSGLEYGERVAVARLQALLELLPAALDRELAPVGVTCFEYTLLAAVGESEGGRVRLSALAARTNATLPRLSRVVTGLESRGLVARVACSEDGRATNAVLTPGGSELLARATPVHDEAVRRLVLAGLPGGDVDELSRLALGILSQLDPGGRLAVTADAGVGGGGGAGGGAGGAAECAADPAPVSRG